jgi:hypothetical protein
MNLRRFTKINVMKIEYKIPESLKEITLGQYQDFLKLKESLEKETIEDFQFMMQSIKIFASGDLTKLEKLPQSKVSEIFEVVMGIFQKETNKLHKVVTIQGKEYGMHSDLSEITTAEFADIQEYQKKGFQDNLHNILAVLYRPIKRKHKHLYALEPYNGTEERPQLFKKHFPCDAVNGCLVFFSTISSELLAISLSYLQAQAENKNFKQAAQ